MKQLQKTLFVLLLLLILSVPTFALAESDYEAGDGWIFQDGTLTVTENRGLKDYISNNKNAETGKWKYQHSILDVDYLVIGKNVTDLTNEIYEWGQITPAKTTIESGNSSFIILDGWVVNTNTKTLYGAADVVSMQSRSQIDDIPNQVEHIGNGALFNYRETTSITIPPNVTSIGNQSFMWCQKLSSFEFPAKLQTVGFQAFDGCDQLDRLSLGDNVSYIDLGAFSTCTGIETVDIRNTKLTAIRSDMFGACYKLQTMELPESIFKIEELAFRICYALHSLIINSSDLMIKEKAFSSCDKLNRIVFTKGTPKSFGDTLFGEKGRTPDGKSYISDSSDRRGEAIPYPTLYYTAAYANEWAPNGETEWNGYPIQQISQEELDAILAEARGEEPQVVSATPPPTAAPLPTSTLQADTAQVTNKTNDAWMIAVIAFAVMVSAGVVVVTIQLKKKPTKR